MKCSFCSTDIEPGTGKIRVSNIGKTFNLCSSKCEKNAFKLGRNPRKVTWVRKKKKLKS